MSFIVKHSHIFYSQVQSMSSSMTAEWDEENTRIVTNLMVTQVRAGNRPNKILTPSAFDEVALQFKVRTGLDYTSHQIKNKWDKLNAEYALFKKLKLKETGGGWDFVLNTVKQDKEWWKKAIIVSCHVYGLHLFLIKSYNFCYY